MQGLAYAPSRDRSVIPLIDDNRSTVICGAAMRYSEGTVEGASGESRTRRRTVRHVESEVQIHDSAG